jgi:hypothetical protein
MNSLEYYETILIKVSFDESLLRKELRKAVRDLQCKDEPALLDWCREELGQKYARIVEAMMQSKNCELEQ